MNADKLNKDFQIDVFGPSLLTIGSIQKIYIIDIMKLGSEQYLDYKLSQIVRTAPVTFAAFGVPMLINYFRQFYPNYEFLKYVPRILDARIMYHKI